MVYFDGMFIDQSIFIWSPICITCLVTNFKLCYEWFADSPLDFVRTKQLIEMITFISLIISIIADLKNVKCILSCTQYWFFWWICWTFFFLGLIFQWLYIYQNLGYFTTISEFFISNLFEYFFQSGQAKWYYFFLCDLVLVMQRSIYTNLKSQNTET